MPANVRLKSKIYSKLRQLAEEAGVTMAEVLDEAFDELYRKRFLDECNRAYGRIKSDKAWKNKSWRNARRGSGPSAMNWRMRRWLAFTAVKSRSGCEFC